MEDKYIPGLHHCRDIDRYNQNVDYFNATDANCLSLLDAEYRIVGKPIGYGGYGIVLKISPKSVPDPERRVAVKIVSAIQSSVDEIFIACQIDRDLVATGKIRAFTRTYGWLVCDQMPELWSTAIENYTQEMHKLGKFPVQRLLPEKFFMFSELHWMSLDYYRFKSVYECKCLLFEIFYAIYEARRLKRFIHGDFHKGNILIHTEDTGLAVFQLGNSQYRIDIDIRPKIIDFGRSTFNNVRHRKVEDPNYDDIQFFIESIMHRANENQADVADFLLHRLSRFRGQTYNLQTILESDLFSELKVADGIGLEAPKCFTCGNPAKMCYPTAPSYQYCRESCAARLGLIGQLIRE